MEMLGIFTYLSLAFLLHFSICEARTRANEILKGDSSLKHTIENYFDERRKAFGRQLIEGGPLKDEVCEEVAAALCPKHLHFGKPSTKHSIKTSPYKEHWLDMQLFIRMTSMKASIFQNTFLPSLQVFWPMEHLNMIVVLDAENPEDVAWQPKLEKQLTATGMKSFKIYLEEPNDFYHGDGHSRQQWSMFHADKYVTSEYVGFVDTDTLFTTVIHPGALYENGRPIVFGLVGTPTDGWWEEVGRTTGRALQRPEVMRAMNFFPVIIKTSHLKDMRSYLAEQSDQDGFDLAFKQFTEVMYSQFNIMANYVFYYKNCDYSFAFEELKPGARDVVLGHTLCLDVILDEVNTMPRVRVAVHWGYVHDKSDEHKRAVVREGYCRSGGTAEVAGCEAWPKVENMRITLQKELFEFEHHSWVWNPLCRLAQIRHYAAVSASQHTWPDNFEELLNVFAPKTISSEAQPTAVLQ